MEQGDLLGSNTFCSAVWVANPSPNFTDYPQPISYQSKTPRGMKAQLGSPLPPGDRHAVSVYLPTWKDTLAWAQRDPQLLAQLKTGYPRFFVPLVVQELSERLLKWTASRTPPKATTHDLYQLLEASERSALLFIARPDAESCRKWLESHDKGPCFVQHVTFEGHISTPQATDSGLLRNPPEELYIAVYPQQLAVEAKAFWQHTGYGISSRRATYWLEQAPFLNHTKDRRALDLPKREAEDASVTLQTRIAELFSTKTNKLQSDAVFLYPTGMSALSRSAEAIYGICEPRKDDFRVAVFGFLYVDTFKVLTKIHGFDCKLYGNATPSDLDALEADLAAGLKIDALYTEFPGNPLLGSVDLDRLYRLANDYDFIFVVDDTVATSVNVDLISSCDVVCTSLTKMFSGGCNVMGGSIALNPQSSFFSTMQGYLNGHFVDTYFSLDKLVIEDNSADFEERVIAASRNAEHMADTLRRHASVAQVYYPKGNLTQEIYERYKRPGRGYGYLLSIRFNKPEAAVAFHDALDVAKGPSLGTNFTLCCAYALFAHYSELEWAAKFGVVEHLVRISVGIESKECLDELVETALAAAEKCDDTPNPCRGVNGKP
ncbi:hypothetical protein FZEAL_9232 [Fusarium zealandicum]|uniref:Cystathionine gamma-synthase n=1 Tax=Fusarium zealandicum TaxID=1053134 RepID=A0A8H4UCB6_9HYPO|nr:hypothetical protein FZEAL_9232 [Fusarium zealandicum]